MPGQKTWTPAEVTRVTESPRSYVVVLDGTSYGRNRRDLIKTAETTGSRCQAPARQQRTLGDSQKNTSRPVKEPENPVRVSLKGRVIRVIRVIHWLKDYHTS